jgi:hypothetical protein
MSNKEKTISDAMAWQMYKFVCSLYDFENLNPGDGTPSKAIQMPNNEIKSLKKASDGNGRNRGLQKKDGSDLEKKNSHLPEEKHVCENDENNPPEKGKEVRREDDSKKPRRFLIICFPNSDTRQIKHLEIMQEIADQALISKVRQEYARRRPAWKRLVQLRGFCAIRLARVSPQSLLA